MWGIKRSKWIGANENSIQEIEHDIESISDENSAPGIENYI